MASTSDRKTKKLVHGLDRHLEGLTDARVARFGSETAAVMRAEVVDEYRRLIPGFPYLGG